MTDLPDQLVFTASQFGPHRAALQILFRQAAAGIGESIPVPGGLIRAVAAVVEDTERMREELGRLRVELLADSAAGPPAAGMPTIREEGIAP
jgi:hypothetical protein